MRAMLRSLRPFIVVTAGSIPVMSALGDEPAPAEPAPPSAPAPATPAATAAPKMTFKRDWTYARDDSQFQQLQQLVGRPARPLQVEGWIGEAQDIAQLKGRIALIDFWAVWCGPCIAAIPHTNEIAERYKPRGVTVFGVCGSDTRGRPPMEQTAPAKGMKYPTAKDVQGKTASAYGVRWWPFYVLIDREGIIRAAGLRPDMVDVALDALLAEQPGEAATKSTNDGAPPAKDALPGEPPKQSDAATRPARHQSDLAADHDDGSSLLAALNGPLPARGKRVPAAAPVEPAAAAPQPPASASDEPPPERFWREGQPAQRERLSGLEGKPPPALSTDSWMNSPPLKFDELKGKVVLVDFWATWCGPCRAAVPHTNELANKHKDEGLVVIGVCASRGAEKMKETAESLGIRYPIAADIDNATINAFKVDSFPDYYLIDRRGVLRYADLNAGVVDDAVKKLLAEKE